MRFTVSYANSARVERFRSSGELASIAQSCGHDDRETKVSTGSHVVVALSEEERAAMPFASLPSLSCGGPVSCLSSTQSPALEASSCVSSVPPSECVLRWQKLESDYLDNQEISEKRVIVLIQEAFRSSLARLETARQGRRVSASQYEEHRRLLQNGALAVKSEYRRTLQRSKEHMGVACDTACLASKAVNCLATVYPWSSDGFLLHFAENHVFQSVVESPPTSAAASPITTAVPTGAADFVKAAPAPTAQPAPTVQDTHDHSSLGASNGSPVSSLKPPRPLQRLPVKKQIFQKVKLDNNTEALREVKSPSLIRPQCHQVPGSPLPGGTTCDVQLNGTPYTRSPGKVTGPVRSPVLVCGEVRPGLVRPEESRFFVRSQLTLSSCAFCVRSLASMSFVGYRRSTIAVWHARQRLSTSLTRAHSAVDSQSASLGNSFFSCAGEESACSSVALSSSLSSPVFKREQGPERVTLVS